MKVEMIYLETKLGNKIWTLKTPKLTWNNHHYFSNITFKLEKSYSTWQDIYYHGYKNQLGTSQFGIRFQVDLGLPNKIYVLFQNLKKSFSFNSRNKSTRESTPDLIEH